MVFRLLRTLLGTLELLRLRIRFHPHVHVLATAGGLALEGKRFVHSRKDYLFPVEVMGWLLRGKVLAPCGCYTGRAPSPSLGRLMASLAAHKCWIVYAKAPFRHSQHVLSYLGRYTHRVGMTNSRLLDVGPSHVTFRTRGNGTATLHPVAFLGRFIQHVLPDGFHKIRHAGLYASPSMLEQGDEGPAAGPAGYQAAGGPMRIGPTAAIQRIQAPFVWGTAKRWPPIQRHATGKRTSPTSSATHPSRAPQPSPWKRSPDPTSA